MKALHEYSDNQRLDLICYVMNLCSKYGQYSIAQYLRDNGLLDSARKWINQDSAHRLLSNILLELAGTDHWLHDYPLQKRLIVIEAGLSSLRPNYVSLAKKYNMSVSGIRYWCASEELKWVRNRIRDLALEAKDCRYKLFLQAVDRDVNIIEGKCSVTRS